MIQFDYIQGLLLIDLDVQNVIAQSSTAVVYTDPETGITFDTWPVPSTSTTGGMTFGLALPSDALTTDADELVGYLVSIIIWPWLLFLLTQAAMRIDQYDGDRLVWCLLWWHNDEQPFAHGVAIRRRNLYELPLGYGIYPTRTIHRRCNLDTDFISCQRNTFYSLV